MTEVIITIKGGIIQDINLPDNVTVIVMDFDVEGVEEDVLSHNKEGEAYIESTWRP